MKLRRLTPTHETVSAVGLGCVGLTSEYIDKEWDHTEADAVIREAVELGVTLFDTADSYGPFDNEKLIGDVLSRDHSNVVVSTKVGFVYREGDARATISATPEHIAQSCRASLERLQLECIDLYYLHRVDPSVPIEESWGALKHLVDQGLVRELGICEVDTGVLDTVHEIHPVSSVQSELSLWTRDAVPEVLPWTQRNGASFVAFSPLGRGFLTGQITASNFDPADIRSGNPRFTDEAIQKNRHIVDAIRAIADKRSMTSAQVAIAWVLALAPNVFAIPGTKKVSYLRDNCAAADFDLNPDEIALLNDLPEPFGDRY
jgi:aryl-alcohol dehydrogenase-like predicted oxidoreductase